MPIPSSAPSGRRVLAVCMAAGFTTLLDQSVLNIAISDVRDALHADSGQIAWIVAGYSLAFGLALVPGGRLGDVRGRKWLFVTGLAVFTAVGTLAGTAQSAWMLVAARLLQGAGAGLVNAQMIGTLQDVFTGTRRARALGLYVLTGGLSAALGPPLGGLILAAAGPELGWRLTLLLSAPFGLITLVLAVRWLPPPRPSARHSELDGVGLVLVGVLTLLVMLPFIRPPGMLGGAAFAAGALTVALLFAGWQRRYARSGRHPLVHPALARSRPYALGTTVAMAQFGTSIAWSLVQTMFLRDGLGLSALAASAVALPAALAMAATSSQAGRVVQRYGQRAVTAGLALSCTALLAGGLAALWVPAGPLPFVLAGTQLLQGVSTGLIVAPNQAFVLRHAPAEAAGVAGGILQMSQRIAAAVGVSAVSGIYLRGSTAGVAGHRTAYWHATAACVVVASLAVLISLVAAARARTVDVAAVTPAPGSAVEKPRV
ncbi:MULTISPECIES: MFS transporter [Kitasatospora]|uniref:MFS family permease n=2 Tax=Kitasatospora TaxID=2063 RepID=A0ABT1IV39_9ACTN|nr:MFS transporter [Kitasatospora paracochleata]MCP2309003.1 MFS family permease [Kitasatospora paracochleata]